MANFMPSASPPFSLSKIAVERQRSSGTSSVRANAGADTPQSEPTTQDRQSNASQLEIQVPENASPGSKLQLTHPTTGQVVELTAPPDTAPGTTLRVNVPAPQPATVPVDPTARAAVQELEIQVPENVRPGSKLQVTHPDTGEVMEVIVPPKTAPGTTFTATMPGPRSQRSWINRRARGSPTTHKIYVLQEDVDWDPRRWTCIPRLEWDPEFESGCPPELKPYFATPELQEAFTKGITEVNQVADEIQKSDDKRCKIVSRGVVAATLFFSVIFFFTGDTRGDVGNSVYLGFVTALCTFATVALVARFKSGRWSCSDVITFLVFGFSEFRRYACFFAGYDKADDEYEDLLKKWRKVLPDAWPHLSQIPGCKIDIGEPENGTMRITVTIPPIEHLEAGTLQIAPGTMPVIAPGTMIR